MATEFDRSRDEWAALFLEMAKAEVTRLCRADKRIDEHAAMDAATDCVLELIDKVQGMRNPEAYARVSIQRRLDSRRCDGRLYYSAKAIGESIEGSKRELADVDASSDITTFEVKEVLDLKTTEKERQLLETRGAKLTTAAQKKLARLRKRLKPVFGIRNG